MKKCSRCKEEKEEAEFCKDKYRDDGLHHYCRSCSSKINKLRNTKYKDKIAQGRKIYESNNMDKIRESHAKYRKSHRDSCNAHSRKYKISHKEEFSLYMQQWGKKRREDLTCSYVAGCTVQGTTLKPSDIPPELIEVKRLIIKTKRLCKQQSQTSQNLETV